jgi:uncharacterized membrane protein HdeD (DUF308 family)
MRTSAPASRWLEPAGRDWWLFIAWGIAAIIIGVWLFARPIVSASALVTIIAVFWFVGGVVDIVSALVHRSTIWGWRLAGGILGVLVALYVFANPILGALAAVSVLYLLIALAALVNGLIGLLAVIGLLAGGERSVGRVVLSIFQIIFGVLMLLGFFDLLNLVVLVQAIGLLLIGGGIVAAIAAFHFRSSATVAT